MGSTSPYNGFDGDFRDYTWKVQQWLRDNGQIRWDDKPCNMCGLRTPNIMPHLEDYTKVRDFYPLCIECHMKLHGRFRWSRVWIDHLARLRDGKVCQDYGSPKNKVWQNVGIYLRSSGQAAGPLHPEATAGVSPLRFGNLWYHQLSMSPIVMYPNGFTFDPYNC